MIIDRIEINNLQEIEVKKVTIKGQSFVRLKLNIRKQYIMDIGMKNILKQF